MVTLCYNMYKQTKNQSASSSEQVTVKENTASKNSRKEHEPCQKTECIGSTSI